MKLFLLTRVNLWFTRVYYLKETPEAHVMMNSSYISSGLAIVRCKQSILEASAGDRQTSSWSDMMVLLCTEILMEAYECSLAMHINYIRPISCRYDEWRRAAVTATRENFLMDSWLRQTTKTIWSEPLNFNRFLPKPTGTRSNACPTFERVLEWFHHTRKSAPRDCGLRRISF